MAKSAGVLIFVAVLAAACGTPATPVGPIPAAITPLAVTIPTQAAAQPADIVQSASNATPVPALPGDPVEGERIFHTVWPAAGMACSTCHNTDTEARLIGPGLLNVGTRAATRVPGMDALDYIHTSIVKPSAYVVDGFPDIMPKNWGKVFSEAQLNDIIAYLLTLKSPTVATR